MNKIFVLFFFFCVNILVANPPLVIGVAGGTGSGKTTLAKQIASLLGNESVIIEQDCYYKDLSHLTLEERDLINFDDPNSLDFEKLSQDIAALKKGNSIEKPRYNFSFHAREMEATHVDPALVIIVEGILVLNDPELRDLCDLKIYVDTEDDVRILRRIERDIQERGRTFDSVKKQYFSTVKPMHNQYVEPSKYYADVIIPGDSDSTAFLNFLLFTQLKN